MECLFLDDKRKLSDVTYITLPLGNWTIVRNYQQFVAHITKNGLPDYISFDHDLAEEHYPFNEINMLDYRNGIVDYSKYKFPTGLECARWLIQYCFGHEKPLPQVSIHSMNTIGVENIYKTLMPFARIHNPSDYEIVTTFNQTSQQPKEKSDDLPKRRFHKIYR